MKLAKMSDLFNNDWSIKPGIKYYQPNRDKNRKLVYDTFETRLIGENLNSTTNRKLNIVGKFKEDISEYKTYLRYLHTKIKQKKIFIDE